ncbi:BGN_3a_G0045010.mRNA.1.CDS.1 [Saccharomyces cerevisiae]|nr:BGN_3a_G0045010.mRNA.1.CDS.1 [Saccharomyces cerevisiae]CAI6696515.1 ASN_HP1_G0044330.mRNA.1.CDS.1 [Saccharomyces cerevisiae]CAI7301981.1 BGN_3a_G0045010.mRNA.1.CDS.1 [Saccharomyces cerevisiae]CAI7304986.1 ASN_collapsed_G0045660.mRNA.1.CDS.1 [Saccharomyces cerevisiae]
MNFHTARISQVGVISRAVLSSVSRRWIHVTPISLNNSGGSLFGSITENKPKEGKNRGDEDAGSFSNRLAIASDSSGEAPEVNRDSITIENDKLLQQHIISLQQPEQLALQSLLSPLKREIYEANCKINGGFYKKDTIVKLPNSSERYKLKLTKREIEVLEPSVYVQSYRIKSSMKKATLLLRLLGGLDVMKAISQCHFSNKKIARAVAELLQKGVKDGQKLGLKPEDLYISQIWTGSDGFWRKRVEFKARTRIGIISHPYIHVRCILRTKSVTKRRLAYEAHLKEQKRAPWVQLGDKPIRGVTGGVYKW